MDDPEFVSRKERERFFYFPPKCPEPLWNSFNRLVIYLSMRWMPGFFPGDKADSPTPTAEVKNEYAFHLP